MFWAKFPGSNALISPENKEETWAFPSLNRDRYFPCFDVIVNSIIGLSLALNSDLNEQEWVQ